MDIRDTLIDSVWRSTVLITVMNVTLFYVIVTLTLLMTSHAYLHPHRALRRGHVSESRDGEGLVAKREEGQIMLTLEKNLRVCPHPYSTSLVATLNGQLYGVDPVRRNTICRSILIVRTSKARNVKIQFVECIADSLHGRKPETSKYDLSNVLLIARIVEAPIRRITNYDSASALKVCVLSGRLWGTSKDVTPARRHFIKMLGGGFLPPPLPPLEQLRLFKVVNLLFTLIHKCFTYKLLNICNEINYKS